MLKELFIKYYPLFVLTSLLTIIGLTFIIYSNYINPYWYSHGTAYWIGYFYSATGGVFIIAVIIIIQIEFIVNRFDKLWF